LKRCDLKENEGEPEVGAEILNEIVERIVKSLLDVIVLVKLREGAVPLGGYDVMELLYRDFGVLMSSGTVYATLYSMERERLIKGESTRNKRAYTLTEKGENRLKEISEVKTGIIESMTKIFT
jgi:DNA-binding PadR family transcriptional regulator